MPPRAAASILAARWSAGAAGARLDARRDRAPVELARRRAPALAVGDLFAACAGDDRGGISSSRAARRASTASARGMAAGTLLVDGAAGAARRARDAQRPARHPRRCRAVRGQRACAAGRSRSPAMRAICLGGPLAGERAGMAGGVLLVRGRAGRAGGRPAAARADRRRGQRRRRPRQPDDRGHAGRSAAPRAPSPGILMRRGTLVLGEPAGLMPSFAASGRPDPVFVRLLARALAAHQPAGRTAARPAARALHRRQCDARPRAKFCSPPRPRDASMRSPSRPIAAYIRLATGDRP